MSEDAEGSECAEQSERAQRFSIQFGPQIGSRSDVLGDADGVRLDYRPSSGLTLRGLAGYPVLSAEDKFNTSRRVLAIRADLAEGPFWNLSSYVIEQHHNERPDSRTVGGVVRYLRSNRSALFYTDYDVGQASLNALMAEGVWRFADQTRVSAALDIRKRPIQQRQRNYLQHSMMPAEEWRWMLPSDQIGQFTPPSTQGVSAMALGLSHAFTPRLSLIGDVAAIDTGTDEETDSAACYESLEYFSHLELRASNLLASGDSNVFDLRHSAIDSSQISSAGITTRYDINWYWTINPRFTTDYKVEADKQLVSRVSSSAVKMEYRWKNSAALQFELGGRWLKEAMPNTEKRDVTYFLALGYQTKF